jgi:hypothetical protein
MSYELLVIISNPRFIVIIHLCSLPLRSLGQERFNHSNATGIDISYWLLIIGGRASGYVFPGRAWEQD